MRVTLLSLLPFAAALPSLPFHPQKAAKGVYWVLTGDSTTAPRGGWGDAFLSTTVAPGSSGHNLGHSGATTASFRAGGDWAQALKDIENNKQSYDVYVTIQFGHNDQKNTSGVDVPTYKNNLKRFAAEATSAGATPILVTPLTRRQFSGGKVISNLAEQRQATIDVATANKLKFIDLNLASERFVNSIGEAASKAYNLAPTDRTHLNDWGGVVFSRLVSDLLLEKYGSIFDRVTKKNETMSALIAQGKPV